MLWEYKEYCISYERCVRNIELRILFVKAYLSVTAFDEDTCFDCAKRLKRGAWASVTDVIEPAFIADVRNEYHPLYAFR